MSKRDEIAKLIQREETEDIMPPYRVYPGLPENIANIKADKILALLTDKWEVVEECNHCDQGYRNTEDMSGKELCITCHGSGTITRQATIEELEEFMCTAIPRMGDLQYCTFSLKAGSRLRRKEADK